MLQGFPDWFLFREFRIRSRSVNLPPPRSPSVPSSFIPPLPCSRACEPAIIAKGSSTSARPMLTQSHELCLCNCVSQHAVVGTFAQRLQGAPPNNTHAHTTANITARFLAQKSPPGRRERKRQRGHGITSELSSAMTSDGNSRWPRLAVH